MSPSINLRVSRNDRSLARPTVVTSRASIEIDPRDIETPDESVAEVIASQGPTVLDVQHVGQVRPHHRRARGWLALGTLMLLAGTGVVASEVTQDWDGYRAAHQQATAAGRPVPAAPGHGLGGLGVGLALLGLVPFGLGLVRRHDTGLDHYTLGEDPRASFPVPTDTLPHGESFGLVQRHGDRYALGFTPQMRGEVHWSGRSLDLDALVAGGHTLRTPEGHAFVLPNGARARIEHHGITYRVATVARGRSIARVAQTDKPFWIYNAGSFAVVGTLLTLVHLVPEDALAMSLDQTQAENRFVGYLQQPDETEEPVSPLSSPVEQPDHDAGGEPGPTAPGPAGAMGDPSAIEPSGLVSVRGPKRAIPQISRHLDLQAEARDAGILGEIHAYSGHVLASADAGLYTVGHDDADLWGNLRDDDPGASVGVGGLGLRGIGRHGGGNAEGTFNLGTTRLLGKQRGGDGGPDAYGDGPTIGHRRRRPRGPRVHPEPVLLPKGSDGDAIRRVVRSHINQVRHCYNQGLVRDPNLRGRVAVRFSIGPVGKVVSAAIVDDSLGDRTVGDCVRKAVRRWQFPRPLGGGSAMVTYPFSFSPG